MWGGDPLGRPRAGESPNVWAFRFVRCLLFYSGSPACRREPQWECTFRPFRIFMGKRIGIPGAGDPEGPHPTTSATPAPTGSRTIQTKGHPMNTQSVLET